MRINAPCGRLATAELLKRHGLKPSKQSAAELEAAQGGDGSADDAYDSSDGVPGSGDESGEDEPGVEGSDAGAAADGEFAEQPAEDEEDDGSDSDGRGADQDGDGDSGGLEPRPAGARTPAAPSEQAAAMDAAARSKVSSSARKLWPKFHAGASCSVCDALVRFQCAARHEHQLASDCIRTLAIIAVCIVMRCRISNQRAQVGAKRRSWKARSISASRRLCQRATRLSRR